MATPLLNPRANYQSEILATIIAGRQAAFGAYMKDDLRALYRLAHEPSAKQNVLLLNRLKQDGFQEMRYGIKLAMSEVIESAMQYATGASAEYVGLTARIQAEAIAKNKTQFRQAYQRVGQAANDAAIARYKDVRASRPENAGSYRLGERYSGGVLLRALASPSMFVASSDGLAWPSFAWLDRSAKQWYRMNFGAGLRGQRNSSDRGGAQLSSNLGQTSSFGVVSGRDPNPSFQSYQVTTWGNEIGTMASGMRLSFKDYSPSASFMLPGGFWLGGGGDRVDPSQGRRGQDQFMLMSSIGDTSSGGTQGATASIVGGAFNKRGFHLQRRKMSQGIAAWGFLDAGLSVVAQGAPAVTASLVLSALNETIENPNGGALARLNINNTVLSQFSVAAERRLQSFSPRALK